MRGCVGAMRHQHSLVCECWSVMGTQGISGHVGAMGHQHSLVCVCWGVMGARGISGHVGAMGHQHSLVCVCWGVMVHKVLMGVWMLWDISTLWCVSAGV